MTTFTEDFNTADANYTVGQTADLGVNNWYIVRTGTGIFSNTFSKTAAGDLTEGEAALLIEAGNQAATITTAAVSTGTSTGEFGITLGLDDPNLYTESWFLFVQGRVSDGLWRYQVFGNCSNFGGGSIGDLETQFLTGSTLTAGDTLTLEVTGTGLATIVTVKQNGATLATYTSVEMLASGFAPADFDFLPSGAYMALTVGNSTSTFDSNRIDTMSATVTPIGPIPPVDYRLPAMASDVPYLQGNDRYQTVMCVNRGSASTPPEFRYWYAGPPSWDESV